MQLKLDPIAYGLLVAILLVQLYATFARGEDMTSYIDANDEAYRDAVFDDSANKGVMHQIFRQNEVDRDLLKAILATCSG